MGCLRRMRTALALTGAAALVLTTSCADSRTRTTDAAPSSPPDAGADAATTDAAAGDATVDLGCPVDVLLVMDRSGSMGRSRALLSEMVPTLVASILTGDSDADGVTDDEPVRNLQVGVITADMGAGAFDQPDLCPVGAGDDGLLQTGDEEPVGCFPPYPTFTEPLLEDDPALESATIDQVRCTADQEANGCAYEQPLEATLRALAPSTAPLSFHGERGGHGDGPNAGFLRPEAALLVVIFSDEDDCSVSDPWQFQPPSVDVVDGDVRGGCPADLGGVHPLSRYIDGLLALKESPGMVGLAVIAGTPVSMTHDPLAPNFDALLDDPLMADPSAMGVDPEQVCSFDHNGDGIDDVRALPARRLVTLARDLDRRGASVSVQSLCNYGDVSHVARQLGRMTASLWPEN